MRLTVANLINSRIPAALGLCLPADRIRFIQWLNEAEARLLAYGRWIGSIQEAQFCVRKGCLVWPRCVQTIEQVAICNQPIPIHNAYYEFTQQLAQVENCDSCCSGSDGSAGLGGLFSCGHAQMRLKAKKACSFDSTLGSNKVLRFYPTHSSDVGKTILVQGFDENNIWVRTLIDGTVTDGELVTLALPHVDTATLWYPGQPTALQKQVTNYRVLMYEYDTVTTLERQLGDYQPTETNPQYQVSFIPGFSQMKCCGTACSDDDDDCNPPRTVTAIVKLAHIDVSADSDWVLFQNIAAYKEAMLAVRDWENGDFVSGNFHFYGQASPKQARMSNQATLRQGGAIPMLRAELRSVTGDNTTVFVHHENDLALQYAMGGFR